MIQQLTSPLEEQLGRIETSRLRNYCTTRYRSAEQAMPIRAFPPAYGDIFRQLYADLRILAAALVEDSTASLAPLQDASGRLSRWSFAARQLGMSIDLDEPRARAVHDIRGGALTALMLELQSCLGDRRVADASTIKILVRDHLKIMRNLLEDIDEARRQIDLMQRPHSLASLVGALESFLAASGNALRMGPLSFEDRVFVADSCVEFAALERAAYNLLNNAVAHAGESAIEISVEVIDGHLRLAVGNGLTRSSSLDLSTRLALDRSLLFRDFSTTGSGRGLCIVADLVGNAYGVTNVDELVNRSYVGTAVANDAFIAWIHWPVLAT